MGKEHELLIENRKLLEANQKLKTMLDDCTQDKLEIRGKYNQLLQVSAALSCDIADNVEALNEIINNELK